MDISVFRERMKQLLLQLPDAKLTTDGKEIRLRCRYCGDSRKQSERHMYVQLPNGIQPMFYNCFRINCSAKGIVTWDKLEDWGVMLSESDIKDIIDYNKFINKNMDFRIRDKDIYPLVNTMYNVGNNQLYDMKLKYINDRLGTNFNHAQIKRLKISLNILELIRENNLSIFTQPWRLQCIAEKYITFITQDNVFTVSRNIDYDENKNDKYMNYRYFKYKLFDTLDDSNRCSMYILPTNINIYYPVKIYLTEGTFDILSVKYNIVRSNDNCIYCAVLGSGYLKAINYFISTMKFINCEFHLYIDNDMNNYEINKICNKTSMFGFTTYVHRNGFRGEKDFGVPKERIIDNVELKVKGW